MGSARTAAGPWLLTPSCLFWLSTEASPISLTPRIRSLLLCLCALGALAAPATAHAASATVSGGTLSYVAGAGEVNTVTITQSASTYVVSDPGRAISLANGTTVTGSTSFPTTGITNIVVDGGDANDSITVSPGLRSTLIGGTGDDSIIAGGGNDTLTGGDGNDTLSG